MSLAAEIFNSATGNAVSSKSINLTTAGPNRIALLFVYLCGATRRTVTGVSGGTGLTWAKYTSYNFDSSDPTNFKQSFEIWWAYAAAQQTAESITATFSGSSDTAALGIGAISGVPPTRFTNPFDADVSLPQTSQNPSASTLAATQSFSTHDSANVGLCLFGSCLVSGNTPDTPSGWTNQIALSYNDGGFNNHKFYIFTNIYAAQQVGTSVALGSKVQWGMLTAAIGGDILFPHGSSVSAGF